jgi:GH24 family phage-related lysozyme (muramidase)
VTSPAAQIFIARAVSEEGLKKLPYDDDTGLPVVAPKGNLSWGIGFNLMEIGSVKLFALILEYLCESIYEPPLQSLKWYQEADPVRQSVFLDMAYNLGVGGLIKGFPLLIGAAGRGDWPEAAKQCTVLDAGLDKSRYAPLRAILLSGVATP